MKSGLMSLILVLILLSGCASAAKIDTADDTVRWRGFNLLNMFWKNWKDSAFEEKDIKLIHEFGFNFVRLPLDYRIWTDENDGSKLNENKLKQIDDVIQWGQKYKIHVSLNLHRAPGYTVSPQEPEKTNLWRDLAAQEAFLFQWKMFALRYKNISSETLSFNLLNEPANVEQAVLEKVFQPVIKEILKISPGRLIILDGLDYGEKPLLILKNRAIVQSTRGYQPKSLVGWSPDNSRLPPPQWPMINLNRFLYGNSKKESQSPLEILGSIPAGKIIIHVSQVSAQANLKIHADGREIWSKKFSPGPGSGEWREVIYQKEWSIYQNRYDRDYEIQLESKAKSIRISVDEGDWLTFSWLKIIPSKKEEFKEVQLYATNEDQNLKQSKIYLNKNGSVDSSRSSMFDRAWLTQKILPWQKLAESGTKVFIGEFGTMNTVPHDFTLAWMEDQLKNWQDVGWGWALWNFRGEHGIFDSNRKDVIYENYDGHKLDRKMLELLQKY